MLGFAAKLIDLEVAAHYPKANAESEYPVKPVRRNEMTVCPQQAYQ
jgi:hypothetical protein